MSDEFKRKLEAYQNGELSGAKLEVFEKELDKLEVYQEFLQENERKDTIPKTNVVNDKKQKKILRRGKWQARFQTALTVFRHCFIAFTSGELLYLRLYITHRGEPDRVDVYRNVVDHTLTVTNPYGYLGGSSTNTKPYFGLEATRELKQSGGT